MNIDGNIGDFFNHKAAELTAAANQSLALGLQDEAAQMRGRAAFVCELFADYRTRHGVGYSDAKKAGTVSK